MRSSTSQNGDSGGSSVAIFLPSLAGGGAERVCVTLASGLHERGWDVDMLLANATGPLLDMVPGGVRVVDLAASRVAFSYPALVRYLRSERPATLLGSLANANIVAVAAAAVTRQRPRTVVVEHVTLSHTSRNATKLRHRLVPPATRLAYPRADAVVAVSEGVADDLTRASSMARGDVTVIPNPVIGHELRGRAAAPLDHPWFRPGEPPVILSVGSLIRRKAHGDTISAFARLRRSRQARLLILGEGEERGRLQRLAARLGVGRDVRLPGYVPNPYPYMKRAALLALSSRSEGLPTVLIESMALGTRLVATDCPFGPSEILEGGRHGALVDPGDTGALATAMEQSLDGPRPEFPAESLARYSVERALDSYERILRPAP
jgi:glycosyltransferase involved in cell wall biosynthesis